MEKPLVSVVSITYNQEDLISRSLDSWTEQVVDCEFEIIIGDDCSTDDTAKIIKEYQEKFPNRIKLIVNERNLGHHKNLLNALSYAQGEFISICAGDDYWIDTHKLQKQKDFLIAHEDCSMVFSNYKVLNHSGEFFEKRNPIEGVVDLHTVLKNNFMPLFQTGMYRRDKYDNTLFWNEKLANAFNEDWVLLFRLGHRSKIGFLADVTTVYEVGIGITAKSNNVYKWKNGLRVNKTINQLTNYEYDYHIGGFGFHYRNIAISYVDYKQRLKGIYWFLKTEIYVLTHPKREKFFSKTNWNFVKHCVKGIILL